MCLLRFGWCVFILFVEADRCMLLYVFVAIWAVCVYSTGLGGYMNVAVCVCCDLGGVCLTTNGGGQMNVAKRM